MVDIPELLAAAKDLEPDSAERFRMYVSEAVFFAQVLAPDLDRLGPGCSVLELGSGAGLLAMTLADRGLRVTAVEPQSGGFSEMKVFRELAGRQWPTQHDAVTWVDGRAKDIPRESLGSFDYGYAINVVEHVGSIPEFVSDAVDAVRPGRGFRFICPNYHLPYEPHFNMPTLFSKGLTARFLRGRIEAAQLPDADALWDELSWPTTTSIRRIMRQLGLPVHFSPDATIAYLQRAVTDEGFVERKGQLAGLIGRSIHTLPASAFRAIPPELLPLIDARVVRPA